MDIKRGGMMKLLFAIVLLIESIVSYGQNSGDYRTSVSGIVDWSNVANWEIYNGTTWEAATEYPGQNVAAGEVVISNNTLMTVDLSIPNSISSLVIAGDDNNTSVVFGGAYSLTVVGHIAFAAPSSNSVTNLFDLGTGILNCSSVEMTSTSDNSRVQCFTISSGELNVSNSFTMSTSTQNVLSVNGPATIRIGDTFTMVSTVTLNSASTVEFNGPDPQVISSVTGGYGNLILSGTGSKTLQSAITIKGNLTIGTNVAFNDGGFVMSGTSGIFSLASGAVYTTTRTASPWFPTNLTPNIDANSTVVFSANASFTLPSSVMSYGTLVLNGTGTKTLSTAITINKDLTISSGTLADGGYQITGNPTGVLSLSNGTGLTLGSATSATSFPSLFVAGNIILGSTSTVTYYSKVAQVISSIPTYGNLTISSASAPAVTKTLDGDINNNGVFTIGLNNILDDNGKVIYCNSYLVVNGSHIGTGKIVIQGNVSPQYLSGAGSVTNLEIAKASGTAYLNSNFTAKGNTTVSSGIFSLNARVFTTGGDILVKSGSTFTVNGNSILKVADGKTITNQGNCNFVGTTSTVALVTNTGTGKFSFVQNTSTAILSARFYEFDFCNLVISGGAVSGGSNNLSNGTFSNGWGNEYINFDGFPTDVKPSLIVFNAGPIYNIRKTSGIGVITISGASGVLAGQSFENDNGVPGTLIDWKSGNTYYSVASGNFSTPSNWNTIPTGGGSSPATTDLTNGISTFIIQNGNAITVNQNIDVYHLSVMGGGFLIIGNSTIARTIQVEEDFEVKPSGTVSVAPLNVIHSINLFGDLIIDGSFDVYNNTNQAANLNFYSNTIQALTISNPATVQFNSINLAGLTSLTVNNALDIEGNVTLGANTTFNAGGYSHTVAGNWTGNTTATFNSSGTVVFDGTSQLISGTCTFNNVSISGLTGVTSIGGSASTITINGDVLVSNNATLTIGSQNASKTIIINGNVQIAAGSTINVGAFNATHVLTISGNLTVDGIFDMYKSSGQVCNLTFTGVGNTTVSGSGTTCRFNAITINKGVDASSIVEFSIPFTQIAPTASANYLVLTNGTCKITGAAQITPYYGSQIICSATSRLWINNASAKVACVGAGVATLPGTPTVYGILQVSAGTFEYGSGNDNIVLTASTSSLIVDGSNAVVKLYGGINNNGSGSISMSDGTIIVDCQRADVGGDNFTANAHLIDLRGVINLSGGTLVIVDPSALGTSNSNATLLLWTLNASDNFIGSTIQFGDGVSTSSGGSVDGFDIRTDNTGTYYLGNIVVNTGTAANRHVKLYAGNAFINGNLTITSGELQLNGLIMYLKGHLVNKGIFNTTTTNSSLILNGSNQQTISGTGNFTTATAGRILNLTIDNNSSSTPSIDLKCPLTIQSALTLTNGSLNTSGAGSITLGTNSTSTLSITRSNGFLLALPTWNITGVTCNIRYNAATGNIITGNELPATTNGNIATLTINNSANSVLLAKSDITVATSLTLMNGIFNLQNNSINIKGTISRNGTTQIGTLSTGTGASITFGNTSALTIPAGCFTVNPTEFANLTLNTSSSVTLSSNIILNGVLTLTNGVLALSSNTLLFHTNNAPIVRTNGTITTTISSSVAFGSTGNTSGAAFTIPSGTFTAATVLLKDFTVNRDNKLTLTQPLALSGTLMLTKGELDNSNLAFTTSGTTPFVRTNGTLTMGTTGSMTFNTNASAATIPNGLFTSAPVSLASLTVNRIGGIILGNQEINVTGTTTLTNGIVTIMNADLQIQTISGTPSASKMFVTNGTGWLKRSFAAGSNPGFTFPIGDNTATAEYSPFSMTLAANSNAGLFGVKVSNLKHTNNTETDNYINRYWSFYKGPTITNYTYTATYTYPVADVVGTQENNFQGQLWNGTSWLVLESSSTNASTHVLSSGTLDQTSGSLNNTSVTSFILNRYYWAKTNGNWSSTSTWEYSSSDSDPGVGLGTPATIVPSYSNNKGIYIRSGKTVTLSAAANADQLTVAGTLNASASNLTVYNGIGSDITVLSGGVIQTTSGQIIANNAGVVYDISGTIKTTDIDGFSGSTLTTISNANSPTIVMNTGSTIEYSATGAQTITTNTDYPNLKISGTGNKSFANSFNINGDLIITSGNLVFGTTAKSISVSGNLVGAGGTIDMTGAAHNLNLAGATNALTTLTTDANQSVITYNRAGDQTVFESINYRNLVIAGTGIKTMSAANTINKDLTINVGVTYADAGYTSTVLGDIYNNGTHSGSGKIMLTGTLPQFIACGNATFGKLELNNTGNASISGTQATFSNLTLTDGTFTLNALPSGFNVDGQTTVNSTMSIQSNLGDKNFKNVLICVSGHWIDGVGVNEDYNISGDFKNNGDMVAGHGKYILTGSANQIIDDLDGVNLDLQKTGGNITSTLSTLTLSGLSTNIINASTFTAPTNLIVSGNININGGTINWGTNVELNGTTTQTFFGTIPAFTNLTINNSNSGDGFVLSSPITVNGLFALTHGIVKTTATNILKLGATANVSGTFSNASYIDGPVQKTVISTSPVSFSLPIGKLGVIRRVDVTVDQASSSPSTTYTCEYFRSSAQGLHSIPASSSIVKVSDLGYWHIAKSPESLDASGNDAYLDNASIKLYYQGDDGVQHPEHLLVAKSNVFGEWLNVGGTADAVSVTSGNFHAFCDLSLASDCNCNSLPITLSKFTLSKQLNNVQISWETSTEIDNQSFTVERSFDGVEWESINIQNGAGNSTELNKYYFVDGENGVGTIYYRLKQTDFNGEYTYSEVKSIKMSKSDLEFIVYPNPSTTDQVLVRLNNPTQKDVLLKVVDNLGRVLYSGTITINNNVPVFNLCTVCHFVPGVFYNISVTNGDITYSKKISVQ